ncbi:ankyrin repeat domain-containing protein [Desulfosarcina ovata]|uniref:Uncharacterized protein n=1 Tax=Desulfosarcina ovata subsp. ovata TaxID=2752305 RepID=A0A5K8ADP6_9BACT|nr:ankyrin repeat domain-containing protein [Desulfosarcina ovata]BBO90691.1 hypothetical protein DSCOOX_38710 [Desulfosarcina ovata subsp. ovata]
MIRANPAARIGWVFFLLFLGMLLAGHAAWGNDFTADISARMFNSDVTGKVYASDGRYRMDLTVAGDDVEKGPVVVTNRVKGVTLLLNPNTRTYDTFKSFSLRAYMLDPFQAITYLQENVTRRRINAETVAGYACDHDGFYDQDVKLADVWFARDLDAFPVKAHIVSGRKDGAVKVKTNIRDVTLELSNIKVAPIDSAVFAIPAGYAKEVHSSQVRKDKPAITQTVKGSAPWGRRIGQGGEIQVAVDPHRPVAIVLKNLTDRSSCRYRIIPQNGALDATPPQPVALTKKWQKKRFEIKKSKKSAQVMVHVEEGLVYAAVTNEADPFAFSRDRKIQEGYLHLSILGATQIDLDPARPAIITVTGDSQDAPESRVVLKCFQRGKQDKTIQQECRLANGDSEVFHFAPEQQVRACDIGVKGENDGIVYRAEQPAAAPAKTRTENAPATAKPESTPKIVRTPSSASVGRTSTIQPGSKAAALDKATAKIIIRALNNGDVAAVRERIDNGMDPNALVYGAPLLQSAANLSTADMVKMIITRGGDLAYRDRSDNDALSQAQSNRKHWQAVIAVLVEAGAPVNDETNVWKLAFKTKNGVFQPGVRETLGMLFSKGADINKPISKSGTTLLMHAAKKAWLEPLEFYLDHGADIDARDGSGQTALDWARTPRRGEKAYEQQNRQAIIERLVSLGAP